MKNSNELFYETMNYPIPDKDTMAFFQFWAGLDDTWFAYNAEECSLFNRDGEGEYMNSYRDFLKSYQYIWKYIPFVEQVYLANSITFNALHKDSDIDLFIITKHKRLRIVRFLTWFILWLFWISRYWNRKVKKLCLSFYVSHSHTNLYSILLQPLDIYLVYWLAHLVPYYSYYIKDSDTIWKKNKWLKWFLPHHPLKQVIRLWIPCEFWSFYVRDVLERILRWVIWDIFESVISLLRKPILQLKKMKLGKIWWWIIISDDMLKFHGDKRKDIMLRYMNKIKK